MRRERRRGGNWIVGLRQKDYLAEESGDVAGTYTNGWRSCCRGIAPRGIIFSVFETSCTTLHSYIKQNMIIHYYYLLYSAHEICMRVCVPRSTISKSLHKSVFQSVYTHNTCQVSRQVHPPPKSDGRQYSRRSRYYNNEYYADPGVSYTIVAFYT